MQVLSLTESPVPGIAHRGRRSSGLIDAAGLPCPSPRRLAGPMKRTPVVHAGSALGRWRRICGLKRSRQAVKAHPWFRAVMPQWKSMTWAEPPASSGGGRDRAVEWNPERSLDGITGRIDASR